MGTNNTKQAAWVALASLFQMGFSIVSAMILSRYFDKIEYGTYKQVLYIYSIIVGMFTLGLPKAYSYFLPRSPINEAKSIMRKISRLFYILGFILTLLLFFGSGIIAKILNNPDLSEMLKIFSPVPFFLLPTLGLQSILVTYQRSHLMSVYVILTSVANLLFIVLPVLLWGFGCREALIGFNIGAIVTFICALYLKNKPVRGQPNDPTDQTYLDIFKFTLPLFIATIWGTLINATDQFFISHFFGTEVFAEFSNGAMELPFVGMILGSTSAVLTPFFSKKVKEGGDMRKEILPVWNSAFAKSAMLIYPITIFCLFEAKEIMTLMYGELYANSADFFRIKLFTYFIKIITFYSIIVALGATLFYQRVHFWYLIVLVSLELLAVYLFQEPLLITAIHVLLSIISSIVFIWYIAKRFSTSLCSMFPIAIIAKVLLLSILICLFIIAIKSVSYNTQPKIITLLIDTIIFAVCLLTLSIPLKINYISIIRPLFSK
ncbi:MAG: lipopolysaccharide biosynthesis protein [Muribaculaceae bacterium]